MKVAKNVLALAVSILFISGMLFRNISVYAENISYNLNYDDIVKTKYNGDSEELLDAAIKNILAFEESKNHEFLLEAINKFYESYECLSQKEIEEHRKNNKFDYIFFKISSLMIEERSNESQKVLIYFSDVLFKTLVSNDKCINTENFVFRKYIMWNYENSISHSGEIYSKFQGLTVNKIKACYELAIQLIKDIESGINIEIEKYGNPSEITSITSECIAEKENPNLSNMDRPKDLEDPYDYESENNEGSVYIPNDSELGNSAGPNFTDPNGSGYVDIENGVSDVKSVSYGYKNGICYKTETIVKDSGTQVNYYPVSGEESNYCDVDSGYYENTEIFKNKYNYGFGYSSKKYDISNKISDKTIIYTIEKQKGELAKYINTKMQVNEDMIVKYKKLISALKLIVKKSESKMINDADGVLMIINGKVYGVKELENGYNTDQLSEIFKKDGDLNITIGSTYKNGIMSSTNLSFKNLYFNGKEIINSSETISSGGNITLYPLKKLCEGLKMEFKDVDGKKAVVTLENSTFIYYPDKEVMAINTKTIMNNAVTVYKDGEYFVDIIELLRALNFKIAIDNGNIFIS